MPRIASEAHDFASSGNFNRTWKLENFSKLDYACGKLHRSRSIHTGKGDYDIWFLKIYPGGDEVKNDGYVSLSLHTNITYRRKMRMQYVVQLRNTDEKILKTRTGKCEDFFVAWGFPKLIERRRLLSELTDDVLVIQVKAVFTRALTASVARKTNIYREVNSKVKSYDMWRLQMIHKRTDFVIAVGRELIPVHSAVLAAQSKVFAAMFKPDNIEERSRHVSITDFDVRSVKAMLQFMYNGRIANLTVDLAKDVLRAADKYEIYDLKVYCNNYLISRLGIDVAVAADIHNTAFLRESRRGSNFVRFGSFVARKVRSVLRNTFRCLRFSMAV